MRNDIKNKMALYKGWDKDVYDTDNNSKLDENERAVWKADRAKRRAIVKAIALKKYDTDNNSIIDENERAIMRQDNANFLKRMREKALSNNDKNNNGKLDQDEVKDMHNKLKLKRNALLDKFDLDGDRKLNDIERENAINWYTDNITDNSTGQP